MATIIDGRGNLHWKESDTTIIIPENKEIKPQEEEIKTMSIEEYRNLKLTDEQEWNNIYNPKRLSIEVLHAIETKRKGQGPDKKIYHGNCSEPGPYYDPHCNHVHVWKNKSLIKNFIGEQSQTVSYVQFTDDKPGVYCSVCHCKNHAVYLKWAKHSNEYNEEPVILQNNNVYTEEHFLPNEKIKVFPNCIPEPEPIQEPNNRMISKWESFMFKVIYSLKNDKIVYQVSRFKSFYLWPWQLTPYQKFKLKFPDYKSRIIFVKSDDNKFKDNYAVLA
tara:strand:+ start:9740 stop:10564 length:825 start_codon:yes stop_codon:yes gene_type:complete